MAKISDNWLREILSRIENKVDGIDNKLAENDSKTNKMYSDLYGNGKEGYIKKIDKLWNYFLIISAVLSGLAALVMFLQDIIIDWLRDKII